MEGALWLIGFLLFLVAWSRLFSGENPHPTLDEWITAEREENPWYRP